MPELHWQSWDYRRTTSSPSTPATKYPRMPELHWRFPGNITSLRWPIQNILECWSYTGSQRLPGNITVTISSTCTRRQSSTSGNMGPRMSPPTVPNISGIAKYHIVCYMYFHRVLIFIIFVVNPDITKFSTHEIFHPHCSAVYGFRPDYLTLVPVLSWDHPCCRVSQNARVTPAVLGLSWDYLIPQYPHDRVSQNARVTPAVLELS